MLGEFVELGIQGSEVSVHGGDGPEFRIGEGAYDL